MPAGSLGCSFLGHTASSRRIAESHADDHHYRFCGTSYHAEQISPKRRKVSRFISPFSFTFLIISLFTQYATALALVGRTKPSRLSASTPLLIDESATPGFGHEAFSRSGTMDINKRQIATDTSISSPSTFPQPFDGGLGNNFTAPSCPLYFQNFLNDPTFQSCHAISMLLAVSPSPDTVWMSSD